MSSEAPKHKIEGVFNTTVQDVPMLVYYGIDSEGKAYVVKALAGKYDEAAPFVPLEIANLLGEPFEAMKREPMSHSNECLEAILEVTGKLKELNSADKEKAQPLLDRLFDLLRIYNGKGNQ